MDINFETSSIFFQFGSAFLAGILASLSPCVYPILPITLGFFGLEGEKGRTIQVIFFSIGQTLVFFLLGLLAIWAKQALGFTSQDPIVQIVLGLMFFSFGLYSLFPKLQNVVNLFFNTLIKKLKKLFTIEKIKDSFSNKSNSFKLGQIPKALLFGMGSSLLLTPCTTPILSSILTFASIKENSIHGALLLIFYSIGFGTLLFLLGIGFLKIKNIPKSGNWLRWLHLVSACILLIFGGYYCYEGFSIMD